jgi:hypothetical protein
LRGLPFSKTEAVFHLEKIEVVFHWEKMEVVFHLSKYWGRLPFPKDWSHFTFPKKLRLSSNFRKIEVVFHLKKNWCRLPYPKKLRLSSNLGLSSIMYGYLVKFCSFPAISLLFWKNIIAGINSTSLETCFKQNLFFLSQSVTQNMIFPPCFSI